MGFRVYEPRQYTFGNPLVEGELSIDRRGMGTTRREDLELVHIKSDVVILTDELTMRIALRAPRDGERHTLGVHFVHRKKGIDPTGRHINLCGALKAINLEPEAVAGRYHMTTKGDLLIVNLTDAESPEVGTVSQGKPRTSGC